jgi:glutamate racemase
VRRLQELLPHEDIVYFGDTGRVPYGTRSEETIRRYAREDCRLLLDCDVKYIIAACGTVSSVAPDILRALPVPAIGVVEATAKAAVAATHNKRVGIIGTAATIRSRSFEMAIRAIDETIRITAEACPLFVPLVEAGWIVPDDDVAIAMVRRYMAPFKAANIDTLILGCTHFPLLAPIIQAELGEGVTLIDSGRETAIHCAEVLAQNNALCDNNTGQCRFLISDQPDGFSRTAEIFLGRSVKEEVESITPEG